MADHGLLNAFNDCINRLNAGDSIESCLQHYPQYAIMLRPMLETGQLVQRASVDTLEMEQVKARMRVRVAAAVRTSARQSQIRPMRSQWQLLTASLLFLFSVGFGVSVFLAQDSLPGESLYTLKRFSEDTWVALSGNHEGIDQRRIEEIEQLLEKGRAANVEFVGEVEQIGDSVWIIEGLTLQLSEATKIPDNATVGSRVEVDAYTTARRELIAVEIKLQDSRQSLIIPSATSTQIEAAATPTWTQTTFTPPPTITVVNITPSSTATQALCFVSPLGEFNVRVRSGGSLAHPTIGELQQASTYAAVGYNSANDGWYMVEFGEAQTGWVASNVIASQGNCDNLPIMTYIVLPTNSPATDNNLPDENNDDASESEEDEDEIEENEDESD